MIATTNQGKYTEINSFLESLPFLELVSLRNSGFDVEAPDEQAETLRENALHKAEYYARISGEMTLADDSGLFIDSLQGWPGLKSKRVGNNDDFRIERALERMNNIPSGQRSASFRGALAFFDPKTGSSFAALGEARGMIPERKSELEEGFGYDPIFYVPEAEKCYSQMDTQEKNTFSHRGKALSTMKYFLQNMYGSKHIVVPVALIVKNGQILMNLRNDPHNPEYHRKWEFPGGSMEIGEIIEENLIREVKEETGYDVELVSRIPYIGLRERQGSDFQCQIFLLPFVCRPLGDKKEPQSGFESLETRWFSPLEIPSQSLIGKNDEIYASILPDLLALIKEKKL